MAQEFHDPNDPRYANLVPADDPGKSPWDEIDFADNKDQRCPVMLLCDTSGSMQGEHINNLNAAIHQFRQAVNNDDIASLRVEMAILLSTAASSYNTFSPEWKISTRLC